MLSSFARPRRVLSFAAAAATALSLAGAAQASAATQVVLPTDSVAGDFHRSDSRAPGTGTFENGPATPPLGTGSFELSTSTSSAKVQLFTDNYDGTRLADIDGLGYSTYRDPASTGFVSGVAALNMRVDLNGDGSPDAYMVYEPYQDLGNAAVKTDIWQAWDAYRGGAAKWWLNSGAGGCAQATPCTWSKIVGLYPNASIEEGTSCGPGAAPVTPCPGSLGFNQGSGNTGIISNVDALTVSVKGVSTTYDFELVPPDGDGDGVVDDDDNCPADSNPGQADNDGDGTGDACDADDDNDTVEDGSDNCALTANTDQANNDGDAQGDACDADDDNDTVEDGGDNCKTVANTDQADADGDGVGTACDVNESPATAADCKNGGWKAYTGAMAFRNQGDCVSFVATKGKNGPKG